jgi:hypothetical protein
VSLALAIGLGYWIVKRSARRLLMLVGMCILSCVLGEVKIFPVIVVLMGTLAILVYAYRRRRILSGLAIVVLVIGSSLGFVRLYDLVLRPTVSITSYLDYRKLIEYFTYSSGGPNDVNYVGRLVQLRFVWRQVGPYPFTMLLGQGIGSMETSKSLGTAGISLLTGNLGVFGANSLAALIGDFGLLGVLALCFLFAGIAWRLFLVKSDEAQDGINKALVIYICTLPLWMFYMDIWTTPITMFLFWLALGQCLQGAGENVVSQMKPVIPVSYPVRLA